MTSGQLPSALSDISESLNPVDRERLVAAWELAARVHAAQLRDEGTPYIDHPAAVAAILWHELGCHDIDALLAAITHDVIEDGDGVTHEHVSQRIGAKAARMVVHLSKAPVPVDRKTIRDEEYLTSLETVDTLTRLVKLADRIHNLRSVLASPDGDKVRRYLAVSRERFIPLAIATDHTAAQLIADACDAIEASLSSTSQGL